MEDKSAPPPPYDSNQSAGSQYPPGAPTYPPASGYGQPPPSGYGQPPPSGYGQPPPSGYGQPMAPGYGQPVGPGYFAQPGPQGQQSTVIIQPQTAVVVQRFGSTPVAIRCPTCHADVVTALEYEAGGLTWLIAGGICLAGLWLGCCFIPFCIDGCKNVIHRCPNCQQVVGKFDRLS